MMNGAITSAILAPLPTRRGRPKVNIDVGPTKETLEKHKPDTLKELLRLDLITKTQLTAGEHILATWRMITSIVDNGTKTGGGGAVESDASARLQAVWRVWAEAVLPTTGIRHTDVVEMLLPQTNDQQRTCDTGLVIKALELWIEAEQEVGREHAAQQRATAMHAA